MATYKDFKEIVKTCLSQVQQVLPVSHTNFLARQNDDSLICLTCNTSNAISTGSYFGHQTGDEVLKEFAAILIQETRSEDIQVRLGGEEFAVFIVNDTPLSSWKSPSGSDRDSTF